MVAGIVRRALISAALVFLAACGGSSPPAATSPAATAGQAPTQAGGGGSTVPATQAPAATQTGGGGGYEGPVCALLTPEDVASVLGGGGYSPTELEIRPGVTLCSWLASDLSNVAGYSLLTRGGEPVTWDSMLAAMASVEVPGLGDRAIFRPLSREIIVQRGDNIFGVGAGKGSHSDAQRQAWAIELARIMLGRL